MGHYKDVLASKTQRIVKESVRFARKTLIISVGYVFAVRIVLLATFLDVQSVVMTRN